MTMDGKIKFYKLTELDLPLIFKMNESELKVYCWLNVHLPFDDSKAVEIDTAQLAEEIGISRRSVQRALKYLESRNLFDVEITKAKIKRLASPASSSVTRVAETSPVSPKRHPCRQNVTRVAETPPVSSTNAETLTEQGLQNSKTIQTYSDFIQTLSEGERESFLKFGEEKAKKLPKPPQLIQKWVEKHYPEISREWYESNGQTLPSVKAAQNDKWSNHPKREEWLAQIRQGKPAFIVKGGPKEERKIREEFTKWAEVNNLVWGTES
ncbi:MAG: HTH domain-containing protein [Scytonema sp. PMC 1069.18]|nr:HTH domain-containing protein [Scytonema sp. PMC 1069.18]MEC4887977.1 HTH domain-containing protein [Scytonema sp. PMC 1070.18]